MISYLVPLMTITAVDGLPFAKGPELGQLRCPLIIFGGSFDPIQRAHLGIAEALMQRKEYARGTFVFVPAAQNPLKANAPLASAEDRVKMIELAMADALPDISYGISTVELNRPGPSYTVDTVAAFRAALPPQAEIVLLLGGDSARSIERWERYQDLLQLLNAVWVAPREQRDKEDLLALKQRLPSELAIKFHLLANAPTALSSTDVRGRVREGLPLGDMVTPAVEHFIRSQRLYLDP